MFFRQLGLFHRVHRTYRHAFPSNRSKATSATSEDSDPVCKETFEVGTNADIQEVLSLSIQQSKGVYRRVGAHCYKHGAYCNRGMLLVMILRWSSACQETEYQLGDRCCRLCPAGTYVIRDCTKSISTLCGPCTEGTYMNQPTAELVCSDCTHCGSRLITKTPCTPTSDTVCEPLEGFRCVDSDRGCRAAKKHSSCSPGQCISRKGTAVSDTVCSNCTEGTFSNGTLTSCQPHTNCESMNRQLIKPGTPSTDAECGGHISNWAISGMVVLLLIVIVGFVLYCVTKKKCYNRETGTAEETSQINSDGTQNNISHSIPMTTVHPSDEEDSHHNNEHKQINGLVNGAAQDT